jgi:hypothetical protein
MFRPSTDSKVRHADVSLHVEHRQHKRQAVLDGSLPGAIVIGGTNEQIEAGAINVCPNGMGIWTAKPILPGSQIILSMPEPYGAIPFITVHCTEFPQKDGKVWILGLKLMPNRIENMVGIFLRFGCVIEPD